MKKRSAKATAARVHSLIPRGVPKHIHVYDNGGKTADRYLIVYTGKYTERTGGEHMYLSIASNGRTGGHGSSRVPIDYPSYGHLGKKITFQGLPEAVQDAVVEDYVELWDLPKPTIVRVGGPSLSKLSRGQTRSIEWVGQKKLSLDARRQQDDSVSVVFDAGWNYSRGNYRVVGFMDAHGKISFREDAQLIDEYSSEFDRMLEFLFNEQIPPPGAERATYYVEI